jgi:hypothetical protein
MKSFFTFVYFHTGNEIQGKQETSEPTSTYNANNLFNRVFWEYISQSTECRLCSKHMYPISNLQQFLFKTVVTTGKVNLGSNILLHCWRATMDKGEGCLQPVAASVFLSSAMRTLSPLTSHLSPLVSASSQFSYWNCCTLAYGTRSSSQLKFSTIHKMLVLPDYQQRALPNMYICNM